ncbi:MAG: leucine-rich repeat domain-containing protein [Treponema sp.]|jgi:hypothetical protein|nr:leucine-rich repeat domain-containing protein [Treponema sp.]
MKDKRVGIEKVMIVFFFALLLLGCVTLTDTRPGTINIGADRKNIGERAYYDKRLWKVVIPNGVESIGKESFAKNKLEWAIIPDSCTEIAADAFDEGVTIIYMRDAPGRFVGDYKIAADNGSVIITNYAGENLQIAIPDEIEGMAVVGIAEYAFASKGLQSVQIPDTVKNIQKGAFLFNNLKEIVIPDSVLEMGDLVFYGNMLTNIAISNTLTGIGDRVFQMNSLGDVSIPDNIISIGNSAFRGNDYLSNVTLGNNLRSIGRYAFRNCGELKIVTIPDSVESIESSAFGYDVQLVGNSKLARCSFGYKPSIQRILRTIGISQIDGIPVSFYGRSAFGAAIINSYKDTIYLDPGKHTFTLYYSEGNGQFVVSEIPFEYECRAGESYQLDISNTHVFLDILINGNQAKRFILR